jgi:hypothetical protein
VRLNVIKSAIEELPEEEKRALVDWLVVPTHCVNARLAEGKTFAATILSPLLFIQQPSWT